MKCDMLEPYQPEIVLAVGAHADDIDFTAAGTIAAWCKAGAHVEYVVLTDGGKGTQLRSATSDQVADVRQHEQKEAAAALGVENVHFLDYEDGNLQVTNEVRQDLVRIIREVKPDTVIVMDPTLVYSSKLGIINHPDHRAAGQATLDAVYPMARDHLSFPELLKQGYEPHKVAHVLLTNFDEQNCFIDISGTIDLKLAALAKHMSQIPDIDQINKVLKSRAEETGAACGFAFAEGFVRIDVHP